MPIHKSELRRTRLICRGVKHPQWGSGDPQLRVKGDLVIDIDTGYPFLRFDNVYVKVDRAWADQAMHEAQNNSKEVGQ